MAVKNLHLEHLEDEILNNGIEGGRAAINFLRELRDMLKGNASKNINMTVKWDGAPAIFCGEHPETKEFFVAKKSLFNKEPKFYTSVQQIKDADELSGQLEEKFIASFQYLSKLGIKGVLQGDLMFTDDKKDETIDDVTHITFQPNTILYAVPKNSDFGKQLDRAKIGIVFHTTYKGDSIENLSASFGADISKLKSSPDVWMDDATYKDVSGNATLTAKETVALTKYLSETGKSFHNIKSSDLKKFNDVQNAFASKGQAGASYKTYVNSLIRQGKFNPTTQGYITFVEKFYDEKVIAKVKTEKTKQIKQELKVQFLRELRSLKKLLDAIAGFQSNLVESKQLIIEALNRIKHVGTFIRTDNGFEVVNQEGYVAIDRMKGNAVKLVDRMEFSTNNFNVAKNWTK